MQAPTYACDTAAHLCRYPAIVRSQEAWKDKSEREKRERERERESGVERQRRKSCLAWNLQDGGRSSLPFHGISTVFLRNGSSRELLVCWLGAESAKQA